MAYRRHYRQAKPTPHTITAKFAGKCICCGTEIKAGEIVTYYPVGTIAGVNQGQISHLGGLDGTSARCAENLRKGHVDKNLNSFAGDGLDSRYEDDCAAKCGL